MRNPKTSRVFPVDPVEIRRFKAIHGLSGDLFESVRPDVHTWKFGSTEYVSEREALAAIGRRATVRGPNSRDRRSAA
jgi:hypothetical protein